MKYSYEFKKECVQLYRLGEWADIPIEKMKRLCFDNVIIYDKSLSSSAEKLCILAEKLDHYETPPEISWTIITPFLPNRKEKPDFGQMTS